MDKKNTNLDLLRILAAFMVLTVHIGNHSGFSFSVGAEGVKLFFILSGYFAFASLDRDSSILRYYKNRITRIVPGYWFCLILMYLTDLIAGLITTKGAVFPEQCGLSYLRYFVFVQCFTPTDNWYLWNNHGALWTMSAFVFFYLLAPFFYRIMKRFDVSLLILLGFLLTRSKMINLIARLCRDYPPEAHIEWFSGMNPLTQLYCFLLGAVLFIAVKKGRQMLYLGMIALLLIITSFGWTAYEFAFVLLVGIALLCEDMIQNKTLQKWIDYLAKGSFSLYLIHPIILQVEEGIWNKIGYENTVVHAVILYILCIGLAYGIYYGCIERIEKWAVKKFI